MRFDRHIKARLRGATPARLRAAARAIGRDRAEVPLFPELVRHQTPTDRITDIDSRAFAMVTRWRATDAAVWRTARRAVRALPQPVRTQVLAAWATGFCPGSPAYLADIVRTAAARLS